MIPQLWAIAPSSRYHIEQRLRHIATVADRLALASRQAASGPPQGATAIVPIIGTIGRWPSWWTDTSTAEIGAAFDSAIRSSSVQRVVLLISSPGGTVDGVPEVANKIYQARGVKPIEAVADSQAGSAAYWIASAADSVTVVPSGAVGSIGVYARHEDWSKANARVGVEPTYISAGPFKIEGNPDSPLSNDARAAIQADVNTIYGMFTNDVAKFRGVRQSTVKTGYGQGRMLLGPQAVAAGLADRVGTLDSVLAAGASGNRNRFAASSQDDLELRRLRWENEKRKAKTAAEDEMDDEEFKIRMRNRMRQALSK
ncbi:MAG TPA: S49 family peptidase [Pirellulales bacterium]|jgi:signal peptide peptidase SppA